MISGDALVFTLGLLDQGFAKTAHGLIRGSDRFKVRAVVDPAFEGKDAGIVMDGHHRDIPVLGSVDEALRIYPEIKYAIVGIAPIGGKLPAELLDQLLFSARRGLSLVSGLHEYVSDQRAIAEAANQFGGTITDIRKPKPKSELHFWSGKIFEVKCPIIAVIGMDCAIGKRSTVRFLLDGCKAAGLKAEMIFTGQTGWMQSGKYGFVLDSTYNDFVSGELEHAIVACYEHEKPDVIFLEGQSSLRNPSGPCGSELLISGNAKKVILLHAPKRIFFDDDPAWGKIPSVQSEINLIKAYGAEVIGLALNTNGCTASEALQFKLELENEIQLPVALPLEEGVDALVSAVQNCLLTLK
ncbi:MAG: DUF1611 domain-containing protein [Saprospiraceae bacterium]|nr:DUF1611 domain-containing protein [Saprospiraceae bacterium]